MSKILLSGMLHGDPNENLGFDFSRIIAVKDILKFNKFYYFGNSEDFIPNGWNKEKISKFVLESYIVKNPLPLVKKITDGKMKLDEEFKLPDDVFNVSEVIFFYNNYILGIYLAKTNKHYFFEC